MRTARIAIVVLITLAASEGQPFRPQGPNAGAGQVPNLTRIPPFVWAVPNQGGRTPSGNGSGSINFGSYNYNPYWLAPGLNGLAPYYYWNLGNRANTVPAGPSYANPGTVRAVGELPAPLQAPTGGPTSEEWTDARTSFSSASAKVSAARRAVEELRARLEAMGQSPRASLITNIAAAEAALQAAQQRMTAGNLEESVREIQRSNYLASQVLKEFGR